MLKKILFLSIIPLLLFPIGTGHSQIAEKEPTLGIGLVNYSPFFYRAEDGSTIILGEVENKKNHPISGVRIWAEFYDDSNPQPLESTVGTTLLDVIQPNGKSPYVIKSSPNPKISNVSVNLLGFNSSPPKQEGLSIDVTSVDDSDRIRVHGTIRNIIGGDTSSINVYLAIYDDFVPPRIVSISSFEINEKLTSDSKAPFIFDEKRPQKAAGFKIFADSANYASKISDIKLNEPEIVSLLIQIADVKVSDKNGKPLPQAKVGTPLMLKSFLRLQSQYPISDVEQPYVYYAQIKNSGKQPFVEFIGSYQDTFSADSDELALVEWLPEKKGLYFVETFVWDPNGVPLASRGPIILILVN